MKRAETVWTDEKPNISNYSIVILCALSACFIVGAYLLREKGLLCVLPAAAGAMTLAYTAKKALTREIELAVLQKGMMIGSRFIPWSDIEKIETPRITMEAPKAPLILTSPGYILHAHTEQAMIRITETGKKVHSYRLQNKHSFVDALKEINRHNLIIEGERH